MTSRFLTLEASDPALEVEGLRHVAVYGAALGRRADCTFRAPTTSTGTPLLLVIWRAQLPDVLRFLAHALVR